MSFIETAKIWDLIRLMEAGFWSVVHVIEQEDKKGYRGKVERMKKALE